MIEFIKKKKEYFITALIVIGLISCVFLFKNIFPFGTKSIIWSDMHEQITAFYYHFYDSFHGGQSLFIDFKTGLGANFLGTYGYYLNSLFSYILLLFPRNYLYLGISLIVLLKFIFCAEIALHVFKKLFPKLDNWKVILLSLLYTFSGYTLSYYVITGWMDVVILFPLLCLSLKKLLDNHDCKMYLIVLTISIFSCFYLSFITLIFVLLASFVYVCLYQEKTKRKKSLTVLGFATVISILVSAVILFPTVSQILESSRSGLDIKSILNSGLGPVTDKLSLFFLSGFSIATLILLFKERKKHKRFLTFVTILLGLLFLPLICEGINKIWHFGSYSFFTMRFAFIPIFLLLIGSGYYLNIDDNRKVDVNKFKYILLTILVVLGIIGISIFGYSSIQLAIDSLTFSSSRKAFLLLFMILVLTLVSILIILKKCGKNNKFSWILISIILGTQVLVNLCFYIGIDYDQERLNLDYDSMQLISNDYDENIYRLKNVDYNLFSNYGNVSLYQTMGHFTSLTKNSTISILDRLGYSSIWTKILTTSGSLFSDALLGNKYLISENKLDVPYYKLIKTYNNRNFYEHELEISFGYLIDNYQSLENTKNSFEVSNIIYNSITRDDEIFSIYDSFEQKDNVLTQDIYVSDKQYLYLDISTLEEIDGYGIMNFAKIIVNGSEIRTTYPTVGENGLLELGIFDNEAVKVEVTMLKDVELNTLAVGGMSINKYELLVENEKLDIDIKFIENSIVIDYESDKEQLLFLPIAYDKGYVAYDNDKLINVENIFEGFVGIKLVEGNNHITLSFIPSGFYLGLIVSLVSIVFAILFCVFQNKILSLNIIENLIYSLYVVLVVLVISVMYVVPILAFIGGIFSGKL